MPHARKAFVNAIEYRLPDKLVAMNELAVSPCHRPPSCSAWWPLGEAFSSTSPPRRRRFMLVFWPRVGAAPTLDKLRTLFARLFTVFADLARHADVLTLDNEQAAE